MPGTASDLELRLCRDAALYGTGEQRVPLSQKALALLAYLLIEARAHPRQHLSALLWSESDEARAAMSLRQALTKLREVVGDRLVATRQTVLIGQNGSTPIRCDVLDFSQRIDADPDAATQIDVAGFLDQMRLTDAPEFEHWIDRTRAQLCRRAVTALRAAAQQRVAKRDWTGASQLAERWLQIEPHSEEAAGTLIEAAFMRRDPEAARRVFDEHTAGLRQMGSTRSSSTLRALMSRLESMAHMMTPAGGAAAQQAEQPPLSFWTSLREREESWQCLAAAYDDTEREGCSRVVIVRGVAGAGRTRLLQDAVAWMASRGATVLSAQLSEAGVPLPYVALGNLLRSGLDAPALGGVDGVYLRELMLLVPELASRFPGVERPMGAQGLSGSALLEALVNVLRALAEDAPVVIAIDDAVWCDRESAGMLQSVMDQAEHESILWLLTVPDDVPWESTTTLTARTLVGATSVRLPPLSTAAITGMLAECSGEPEGWETLASALHAVSHGVPGVVRAAVERMHVESGGDWTRLRTAAVPMPALAERVVRRIESLTDMEREVLLSLALLVEEGHPLPRDRWMTIPALSIDELSHLHGISRLRAARLSEGLIESHLADEVNGGLRCAAPMIAHHMLTRGRAVLQDELRRRIRIVKGTPEMPIRD